MLKLVINFTLESEVKLMARKPKINSENMRGYKIKIYPTEDQKNILNRHIELFRYVYNWGLDLANNYYLENGNYIGLDGMFNALSKFRNENEWMKDIPLHSARLALMHLNFAFIKYFRNESRHPKFKSKKYSKKCVHYRNEIYALNFTDNSVRIPGLASRDRIECKSHNVPLDVDRYYSCSITFDGIDYWMSVNVESNTSTNFVELEKGAQSLGIDLGIKKYAQLSDGTTYYAPRSIDVLTARMRRQQSKLSKMRLRRKIEAKRTKTKFEDIPLTKNEQKLKDKHAKTSIRLKNVKHSFIHKITTEIADKLPDRIVIEDLNITDLIHEKFNNKDEIFHSMWYKFREILSYKTAERGVNLVIADKNFPSSQICSNCGTVRKQSNRNRKYICHQCGLVIDRDLNASINLSRYMA